MISTERREEVQVALFRRTAFGFSLGRIFRCPGSNLYSLGILEVQFQPPHRCITRFHGCVLISRICFCRGYMASRKGKPMELNMPEESENKMKANIIVERVTLVAYPQKTRKRQMIWTKSFWKKEKERGRKKQTLCVWFWKHILCSHWELAGRWLKLIQGILNLFGTLLPSWYNTVHA